MGEKKQPRESKKPKAKDKKDPEKLPPHLRPKPPK
jgi:hypothetical protein